LLSAIARMSQLSLHGHTTSDKLVGGIPLRNPPQKIKPEFQIYLSSASLVTGMTLASVLRYCACFRRTRSHASSLILSRSLHVLCKMEKNPHGCEARPSHAYARETTRRCEMKPFSAAVVIHARIAYITIQESERQEGAVATSLQVENLSNSRILGFSYRSPYFQW